MNFREFVEGVAEKFPDEKSLSVTVTARRDDKGKWSVDFAANPLYGSAEHAKSAKGLLMKLDAEREPAATLDSVSEIPF